MVDNFDLRLVGKELTNQYSGYIETLFPDSVIVMLCDDDKPIGDKAFIDQRLIDSFIMMKAKLFPIKKGKLCGLDILESIIHELDLSYDYKKQVSFLIQGIAFYKKWLKKTMPKRIILTCYYDMKVSAVYAAKLLNIPTYEIQHGAISKQSFQYIIEKDYDRNCYPDKMLCFGESVKKILSNGGIYTREQLIPVGSYYLTIAEENVEQNKVLFEEKYNLNKNTIKVAVIGQYTIEDALICNLIKLLKRNNRICCIYLPRPYNHKIDKYISSSFFVENELNIYQVLQNVDVAIGVYSTSVLESLAIGTPVALLNINNMAEDFFEDLFSEIHSVCFVQDGNIDDLENAIENMADYSREDVKNEGRMFYENDYRNKINSCF